MTEGGAHGPAGAGPVGAAALRTMLVVPYGATNPNTGAGQRTRILFEALGALGPVVVVHVSQDAAARPDGFFPGAAEIVSIEAPGFGPPPRARPAWLRNAAGQALTPAARYAPMPALRDAVAALADRHDVDAIAVRYVRPYCCAGLDGSRRPVLVDVDDRDDMRLLSRMEALVGRAAARVAYAPAFLPRFRRTLRARLRPAAHLWLCKAGDAPGFAEGAFTTWPNVPALRDADVDAVPPPSRAASLLFVGSIAHGPNAEGITWFLRTCWPRIRAEASDAQLRLVGIGNWSGVEAKAGDLPGVTYVGLVPSVAPEYARARAAICPIFSGAGSQIKVIEACAYGRPVICTALSRDGFGDRIAGLLVSADDADGWVEACLRLIRAPGAEVDRIGSDLQRAQRETYAPDAIRAQLRSDVVRAAGAGE